MNNKQTKSPRIEVGVDTALKVYNALPYGSINLIAQRVGLHRTNVNRELKRGDIRADVWEAANRILEATRKGLNA